MVLDSDMVLRVVKTLYGIPESVLNWNLTYMEHHMDDLCMSGLRADHCVLVRKININLD